MSQSKSGIQRWEGTFKGADGLELYSQSWQPCAPVRARAILVHGLGAHGGLFEPLVRALVARDCAVYAFDLRGHGKSPGQRGFIRDWREFREDLAALVRQVDSEQPYRPLFLIGHSLGGTICLDFALHYPALEGVAVLSPPLGEVGASPLRIGLAYLLSRIWPRFNLSTGFDWSSLSRDPEAVAVAMRDPLRHDRATARLATEFFKTLAEIHARAGELKIPLLIQHGSGDRVALPEGSRYFFAKVISPDKELREYPGAYHEMHYDLNAAESIADLLDWLERHSHLRDRVSGE